MNSLAPREDALFRILRLLAARGCAYAIKVGYWSWLPLKQLAAEGLIELAQQCPDFNPEGARLVSAVQTL